MRLCQGVTLREYRLIAAPLRAEAEIARQVTVKALVEVIAVAQAVPCGKLMIDPAGDIPVVEWVRQWNSGAAECNGNTVDINVPLVLIAGDLPCECLAGMPVNSGLPVAPGESRSFRAVHWTVPHSLGVWGY